jgi:hypothetical protein
LDTRRWLGPIVAVLAIVPGAFGALLLLAPEASARAFGLVGSDIFLYRLAGAASFGYLASLAAEWRGGWPALRITIAGMPIFAVGSILAALVALIGGEGTWIAGAILIVSVVLLALELVLLRDLPGRERAGSDAGDIAPWVTYLFAFGAIAALGTSSVALLLGGAGGKLLAGYSGTDSIIYREAGAATLAAAYGAYLALRSRRWAEIGRGTWGALAFNGLSLIAAIFEIGRGDGGLNLLSVAVFAVSLVMTVGLAVAMSRGGR